MAPDSNMVRSPSVSAGTLPKGLSFRYSGLFNESWVNGTALSS